MEWNRFTAPGWRHSGRSLPAVLGKRNPECELLDSRQPFSTLLAAAPAVLSGPLPAAVANATAILNAADPATFSKFESALARAEAHSHVTQFQASKLAQDEAAINQVIDSAGLDPDTTSTDLNQVQNDVDNAFLEHSLPASLWAQKQQKLDQDVPVGTGSSQLIGQTIAQMKVVARSAGVNLPSNAAIGQNWAALANDLGPNPDTDLGPGAADRDPLDVYYDGQINKFIK